MFAITKNLVAEILKKNDEEIVSMHEAGVSWTKIASKLHLCRDSVVEYMIKNHGYIRPKRIILHSAQITPSILDKAKSLYETGNFSVTSIAEQFNVPRKKLSKALKAKGVFIRKDGKKPVNSDYFEKIDTAEKAYWLGLFYADGYNSGTGIELCLKDEDLPAVERFRAALGGMQAISHKRTILNGQEFWSWRYSVQDAKLASDLAKAGAPRAKSFIIRLPELDNALMSHFIRGFFDGDGSFYKRDKNRKGTLQCSISSGSVEFLEELKAYLETVLPDVNWHLYTGRTVFDLRTAIQGTKKFGDYIYKDSSPETRLERKYQLYVDNCRPEPKVA